MLDENIKKLWYTIKTRTNYEKKAKLEIETKLMEKHKDSIYEIFIPTETEIVMKDGKKKVIDKIRFPGYVFINAVMTDQLVLDIKSCKDNQGLMMSGAKATPVPSKEIEKMKLHAKFSEIEPQEKSIYAINENVNIIEGPFNTFIGTVVSIDNEHKKLCVNVNIFNRETPVDLSFSQVSKIS